MHKDYVDRHRLNSTHDQDGWADQMVKRPLVTGKPL